MTDNNSPVPRDAFGLRGQVAVVTGASSGIGPAFRGAG